MTLKDWEPRWMDETWRFRQLCEEEQVFRLVERIEPLRAVEFAEGLVLDLSDEDARARIRSNRPGALALVTLTHDLASDRSARAAYAGRVPDGEHPPFYLLASLVLNAAADRADSGETPRGMV